MKQLNAKELALAEHDLAPDEVAIALQDIVSDVDAFVSDWFKRLSQSVVSPIQIPATNQQLLEKIEGFQQEKRQWEAEKTGAEQDIREKLDEISEAWLRLEAEQRRFLQTKESYAPTVPDYKTEREFVGNAAAGGLTSTMRGEGSCLDEQPLRQPLRDPIVNRPAKSTIQQFQRLRREIESSRPRLS